MMNVIEEKITMHISYSIKPFQMKAWYQGAGKRPQPTLAFFFAALGPKGRECRILYKSSLLVRNPGPKGRE